jgi:DNA-3-methyladenine glycosylase
MPKQPTNFDILLGPASEVAPRLLGCNLVRELGGRKLIGKIVETEAYDMQDAASHSYRGETERTRVMFGPAGHLYVYFTYGMHYCCNVVVGTTGHGAAVLIRAIEPQEGEETMITNRRGISGEQVSNGPAKLCYALGVDKTLNGHDLRVPPLQLIVNDPLPQEMIIQTTRIGISEAKEVPWRFYIKGNKYVSKP